MPDSELLRIHASMPRRVIGVGCLMVLGVLLLAVAIATPPADLGWLVFLLVCGTGALVFGQWTWRATGRVIVLTEDGLFEEDGPEIARMEDIARIDRGLFAFKPSNGFALKLTRPHDRAWRPGLWWRSGRRVAIGGMAAARQTKPVADILTIKLARRDGS